MPGNSVLAGPFSGGLSTYSDPSTIADAECALLDNFETDPDGSLKSRPPFVDRGVTFPLDTTGNMRILGYYYLTTGGVNTPYVIASDGKTSTYYFNGSSWTLITNTIAAMSMVQFNNQLWLVAPTGACGYWTGIGGSYTQDAYCPNGEHIISYKQRMWVLAGSSALSRTNVSASGGGQPDVSDLYYSSTIGTSPWQPVTSGNNQSLGMTTVKINMGDGQANVALLSYQGTLYIFRTASIQTFSYSQDPGKGTQGVLVPNIGLADQQALVAFENYIYFMFDGKAYTLFAGLANILNPKVPFTATRRQNIYTPFAVSIFNRRVIFTYYDTLYVWNLRTQNWSTWHSQGGIGKIVQFSGALNADVPTAVCHSNVANTATSGRTAKLFFLTDAFTTEKEAGGNYVCSVTTKTFDFGAPANFKRLFWWAADASFRGGLTARAVPVVYSSQTTWGNLRSLGRTWNQMLNYSWSNPTVGMLTATATTNTVGAGNGPLRKTVRLLQNERFKQAYFSVSLTVDGSQLTCPARIFMLELFILVKDRVSKAVS